MKFTHAQASTSSLSFLHSVRHAFHLGFGTVFWLGLHLGLLRKSEDTVRLHVGLRKGSPGEFRCNQRLPLGACFDGRKCCRMCFLGSSLSASGTGTQAEGIALCPLGMCYSNYATQPVESSRCSLPEQFALLPFFNRLKWSGRLDDWRLVTQEGSMIFFQGSALLQGFVLPGRLK